jgi:hypothetical protein
MLLEYRKLYKHTRLNVETANFRLKSVDKWTQRSTGRSLALAAHLPNPKQALAAI